MAMSRDKSLRYGKKRALVSLVRFGEGCLQNEVYDAAFRPAFYGVLGNGGVVASRKVVAPSRSH